MPLDAHIDQLQQKHQALESQLSSLIKNPSATDTELAILKREKLKLKDEIYRLNRVG